MAVMAWIGAFLMSAFSTSEEALASSLIPVTTEIYKLTNLRCMAVIVVMDYRD
jgi:hypothetical protein